MVIVTARDIYRTAWGRGDIFILQGDRDQIDGRRNGRDGFGRLDVLIVCLSVWLPSPLFIYIRRYVDATTINA